MPPPDLDEQKFLRAFLEEAEELLEKLNNGLLALEKDTEDADLINEIFRLTHSLKSESALLNFTGLSELAHRLEDVFEKLRAGKLSMTKPLMDAIFSAADLIHEMITGISHGRSEAGIDSAAVIGELEATAGLTPRAENGGTGAGRSTVATKLGSEEAETGIEELVPGEFERLQVLEALDRGETIYRLTVAISGEAEMNYPRAYLVFNNLEMKANVIHTIPDMSEPQEDSLYGRLVVLLSTDLDSKEVRKACSVDLVDQVDVDALDETSIEQALTAGTARHSQAAGAIGTGEAVGQTGRPVESTSIRVDTGKLNEIWQLVGELTIYKAHLSRLHEKVLRQSGIETMKGDVERASDSLDRISSELQQAIMKTRMVPIAVLFNKFPRLVRDLSRKLGKSVQLKIQGKDTEIDRSIVEALSDPLTHIIRNSLDHGLESPEDRLQAGKEAGGEIQISANQQGGKVIIEIGDDGCGLDVDKIRSKSGAGPEISDEEVVQNIFTPGFSTKENVTDLSGRGVGMDVVATRIREDLKGEVTVRSEKGRGTKVRIILPLTLTILHSLIISCRQYYYAIPVQDIEETVKLLGSEIRTNHGNEVCSFGGKEMPLLWLNSLLYPASEQKSHPTGEYNGVVIRQRQGRVCVVVDELVEEEDVVIKPVTELLNKRRLFSGVSVLGDGRILFILDTARLLEVLESGSKDGN